MKQIVELFFSFTLFREYTKKKNYSDRNIPDFHLEMVVFQDP